MAGSFLLETSKVWSSCTSMSSFQDIRCNLNYQRAHRCVTFRQFVIGVSQSGLWGCVKMFVLQTRTLWTVHEWDTCARCISWTLAISLISVVRRPTVRTEVLYARLRWSTTLSEDGWINNSWRRLSLRISLSQCYVHRYYAYIYWSMPLMHCLRMHSWSV